MRRALLALILLLAVPTAQAHAVLQSAEPAPNGHAEAGITEIVLRFSEDVERTYTDADLVDTQGRSMKRGDVRFDDAERNVIHLPVEPLQDGIYSASWKTLSVDTHTARGTFLFSVGDATLNVRYDTPSHDHAEHTAGSALREGFARAAYYGGLFLATGLPLFALVVLRREQAPRPLILTGALFALIGAGGALLGLLFLADRTQLPLKLAMESGAGASLLWRGLLLAGAGILLALALAPSGRARRALLAAALLAGLGAIVATALGSHAAAVRDARGLSITLDVLHLAFGAVWIGGVVGLLHVAPGRGPREVGRLVTRFSPWAVASVVLLVGTGIYASLQHIPRPEALWQTWYGRLVAIKICLLGVLVAIGAYNQRVLGPRLRAGDARPRFFTRVLQVEAIAMVLVLGAAGILASTPPPDRDVQQGVAAAWEDDATTRYTHVIVQVRPNPPEVGLQRVEIILHPLTLVPINENTSVALKVAPPGEREPETTYEPGPTRLTANQWVLEGGVFTTPGEWTLHVLVQRTDVGEFEKLAFTIPIAPAEAGGTAT